MAILYNLILKFLKYIFIVVSLWINFFSLRGELPKNMVSDPRAETSGFG